MSLKNSNSTVLKLLLSIGFLLALAATAHARDQWQIPRNEPPPTGPIGTGRSANMPGTTGYTTPGQGGYNPTSAQYGSQTPGLAGNQIPGGQLPGFTGSPQGAPGAFGGQPGFPGAPGAGGFNPADAGVPGLVQPGSTPSTPMPPTSVPEGKGVLPDFFKQIIGKRLPPGTVLTGVAESNLSSIKSKRGDVFSIALPHGYSSEGEEIIPANSRILGVVVDAAPAAMQKVGQPGRLSISLKTLVFPDGRTTAINGFLDHNPAHNQANEPKTRFSGINMGDYGSAFKGMLYSSVAGITWVHNRTMRGKEFLLKTGTPVSVKLNTSVDVGKMTNPTAPLMGNPGVPGVPGLAPGAVPGMPGMMQGSVPGLAPGAVPGMPGLPGMQGSIPGLAPGAVPGMMQGFVPGMAPGAVPGMPGMTQSSVPGNALTGASSINLPAGVAGHSSSLPPLQGAAGNGGTFFPGNVQNASQFQAGNYAQGTQGAQGVSDNDPNSIFNTPLASPNVGTPEPF